MMRIYLYILAGITSGLVGWNIGQFVLSDLNFFAGNPEVALFPCVATALAIGMVVNEVFISNPTRTKLNIRRLKIPVIIAAVIGLLVGLLVGGISQILFLSYVPIPAPIVRCLGWLLIGLSIGISEGLTWRWYSIEAGDRKRFYSRFKTSLWAGGLAALIAAFLFELLRLLIGQFPSELRSIEDPLGFSLLGAILGFAFSLSTSPSYTTALRAGSGFEYVESFMNNERLSNKKLASIDKSFLKFISDGDADVIEEGLSIKLPATGKISIGSSETSHIYIPNLPDHIAFLDIQLRSVKLLPSPDYFGYIQINGLFLNNRKAINLKHNTILTFFIPNPNDDPNHENVFRFVYYNRFLDPQA